MFGNLITDEFSNEVEALAADLHHSCYRRCMAEAQEYFATDTPNRIISVYGAMMYYRSDPAYRDRYHNLRQQVERYKAGLFG